ncbi:MAG: TRAP transporter substrate-binding protein DctP [Alphaproteobacteria bacterium]|nr:TRAP transporter substrate-binding protein DctP [Alphaproteobacteria bacterium]
MSALAHRIGGAICIAALLSAGAGSASAQPIELKLGDFQSLQHVQSREGTQWFMKEVERRTNAKVKFVHFPAEQAAKARGLLDAAKSGVVDIALVGTLYNADRLPLNSVIGLPGLGESAAAASKALDKLVEKGPLHDEFAAEGVEPLFAYALTPYQILLRNKPVSMPKDWNGMKIRTGGTTQALTVRAFGAAGINLPGPEVYTAVERGTVDGVLFPIPSVPGYNLQEVVKYISTNGSFGNFGMTVVMNKAAYAKLPDDVRKVMAEVGDETSQRVAKAQDDSTNALLSEWKAKGITLIAFSAAEQKAYVDAMRSVGDDWVSRIGKQHPGAKQVLQSFEEAVEAK